MNIDYKPSVRLKGGLFCCLLETFISKGGLVLAETSRIFNNHSGFCRTNYKENMMQKNFVYLGVLLASALLLAGCSASGMKNVEQSGFLGDYSQMKQGGDGDAALTYIKPDADFKPYTKIMFERVAVTLAPSSESNEIDPSMLVELTNYYQNALIEAVKDGYEVVEQPGPDVLWVRAAITDVEPSNPVANTMSSIVPVGMVVAAGAKATSDANLGTGEAATEIEVLDSMSKERLAAAVDRRQGGKSAFRGKWVDTEQAFDYWAKRFRERLDKLRGM